MATGKMVRVKHLLSGKVSRLTNYTDMTDAEYVQVRLNIAEGSFAILASEEELQEAYIEYRTLQYEGEL